MKRCSQCSEVYSDMMHFCPNDGRQLVSVVAQDPLINTTIDGKYLIEAVIGRGGMGVVYRARHANFNRLFAIKILKSEMVNDPQAVKRFRNEANAAGAIRHPNAIAITDFNITSDGLAYLVMDYVEGRSLREILKKEGALPFDRTVKLSSQVCEAVGAAHRKGIIHRDLKPDNIMVENIEDSYEEMVHVLDFGIAKLSQNPAYSENITVGGAILGSPYYMSPEQCDGRQLDPRSDIYSVGIILYEMLTGKVPFRAQTPWGLVKMHCSTMPQPLRVHRPDILPRLEETVLRALSKDPNDRQQSALDLRREIEAALDENQPARIAHAQPQQSISPPSRPKISKDAPTEPLEQVIARQANEDADANMPQIGSKSGPLNLLTTPMEALPNQEDLIFDAPQFDRSAARNSLNVNLSSTEAAARIENSEDRRKLEELAKELEAEIIQLRARKDSSGGIKQTKFKSEPLQEMAGELDKELSKFEKRSSKVSPPLADNGSKTAQASPKRAATNTPVLPYIDPTSPLQPQIAQQNVPEVAPNHGNRAVATTIDSFDIAEEFSLALPEMVEEVLMSVSETITLKAELLSRRVTEEAKKADAQASAAEGRLPGTSLSGKQSRRTANQSRHGQKIGSDYLSMSEMGERSKRSQPLPKGMVEPDVKSDAEFKKTLIKIAAGSIGLIAIIFIYFYFTDRPAPRPPGPGRRPAGSRQSTPVTKTEPSLKKLPDGTIVPPEGMVYIPAGSFLMGRNSDDPCESPQHENYVNPFFIEKYEVTNRRYADFLKSTGHAPPSQWQNGNPPAGQSDYPITGVSWQNAIDYCEWRSRQTGAKYRLPTEAEWELAAHGFEPKLYPWGEKWQPNAANIKESQRNNVVSVGSFRLGDTSTGISDLIGNVAEWTADEAKPYPNSGCKIPDGDYRIVRGGHFNSSKEKATATYRDWLRPVGDDYSKVGFRCVRELQ
jgi:serine/threonine protein kinase/formylglycine-generating enzyme required for sulfatase activity